MKKKTKFLSALGVAVALPIAYNVIDNNRVKLVLEEIAIENLPIEFDGFKILQISDLHCKSFGKEQRRLLKKINSIDYDMIALTGDMGNYRFTDDIKEFIDLLDGIEDKENIFYVAGNNGPVAIDKENREVTEMGKFLQSKGCNILEKPYLIKRYNKRLWVSKYLDKEVYYNYNLDIRNEDIKIAVCHYPRNEGFFEKVASKKIPHYDLILAGHYHGGQFRIPFKGAFYVPDITGDCLFPSKEKVNGLTTWNGYNQYVSRGLGAGGRVKALQFRLFNTPEINILTLRRKSTVHLDNLLQDENE